jgi:hypothetical protein
MVLVLLESTTSTSSKCFGLKRLLGEVTNASGIVQYFPCIWLDSATTALHSRMKEIIARVHIEVKEGMSPDEMIQKCVDIAVKSVQSAPYLFSHVLPLQTIQYIADLNSRGGYKGRKWHLDHLQQPWLAGKCPFKNGDLVLDAEAIMQMWAYAMAVARGEGSGSLAAQKTRSDAGV